MKFKKVFLTLSLLILVFGYGICQTVYKTNRATGKEQYNAFLKGTLGTYASPPHLPNGRVDEKRHIAELKDIHADTYNWLIRIGADDLDALKHFLPLAREARLKIWVTLVPPSEPPLSEPFWLDYDQWAAELAVRPTWWHGALMISLKP